MQLPHHFTPLNHNSTGDYKTTGKKNHHIADYLQQVITKGES
jgi:hypothetical protein